MKQLVVLVLSPGWDATPSQVYPHVTATHSLATLAREQDIICVKFPAKETTGQPSPSVAS